MAGEKNFNIKNGLSVGGVEVIDSNGDIVAAGVGTAVPTPAATISPFESMTSTPPTDSPFFILKFFSPAIRMCLR